MKNTRINILFLVLVVLVVFFPAISNEVNSVDDIHIIEAYGINGHLTLKSILTPAGKFYYRPLTELTFYLDNLIFALDPRWMHLENVFLHTINAVLVFLVCSSLTSLVAGTSRLPLLASLCFAVHPVVVEPVSWIAGRADLLFATFVLVSCLLLIRGVSEQRPLLTALAVLASLFGILAKETALVSIPAMVTIGISLKRTMPDGQCHSTGNRNIIIVFWSCVGIAMLLVTMLLALNSNSAVATFLKEISTTGTNTLVEASAALGYYIRKLALPFPLNFAIESIDRGYAFIGAIATCAFVYLMFSRNLPGSFGAASLFFLLPPVAVAVAKITWTPIAERYLYVPTALMSISFCGSLMIIASTYHIQQLVKSFAIILIVFGAVFSFNRATIWRDNLTLFQDTVNKSPQFGDVHNELGVALAESGDIEGARLHFAFAERNAKRDTIKKYAKMNLLMLDLRNKTPLEQLAMLDEFMNKHGVTHAGLLKMARELNFNLLKENHDIGARRHRFQRIIHLNNSLFQIEKDPFYLYNSGQQALILGNHVEAAKYFTESVTLAPRDAFFLPTARKLLRQIEKP